MTVSIGDDLWVEVVSGIARRARIQRCRWRPCHSVVRAAGYEYVRIRADGPAEAVVRLPDGHPVALTIGGDLRATIAAGVTGCVAVQRDCRRNRCGKLTARSNVGDQRKHHSDEKSSYWAH